MKQNIGIFFLIILGFQAGYGFELVCPTTLTPGVTCYKNPMLNNYKILAYTSAEANIFIRPGIGMENNPDLPIVMPVEVVAARADGACSALGHNASTFSTVNPISYGIYTDLGNKNEPLHYASKFFPASSFEFLLCK